MLFRSGWTNVGAGQWRFNDDIVTRLVRGSAEGELWLATRDGAWLFNLTRGRTDTADSFRSQSFGSEAYAVDNPALKISCLDGQLTFSPADGVRLPAFERGRFFYDNGTQLVSDSQALYTLVNERGIVRRSSGNPIQITGFWPIPTDVPARAQILIEPSAKGIRDRKSVV